MATKMYKDGKFTMVRGMDAKAHLDDGWTFEPSKTSAPKPKRKYKLKVKDVEVIKNDPVKGKDQDIEEINNGD